jgi:hypothetical protein
VEGYLVPNISKVGVFPNLSIARTSKISEIQLVQEDNIYYLNFHKTMSNIEFEKGEYGIKATIKTVWQDSFLKLLIENEVKELELNDGKGWRGNDVNFLQWLPNLKALTIIDFDIKSIEAVHYLSELQKMDISTYCKTPINFDSFQKLTECGFEWIKGSDSLFERSSIKRLFINSYDQKSKIANSEVF